MNSTLNPGIRFIYPEINDLVSVIIPSYNRENTIERAVQSVLNQTYKNVEVIVVDDCSTDQTLDILNNISDKRLKVIKLQENSGACVARNIGAANSCGSWIAFQDSDDEWLPQKLEKQVAFMKNGNYDFSFCQATITFLNGRIEFSPKQKYGKQPDRDWYHVLMTDFPVSTQKFVCTREVMRNVGFDPEIRKSQDKDFALQVAYKYRVGYLAEPLVKIYATKQSITYSSNQKSKYESVRRIVDKHLSEVSQDRNAKQFFYANLGDYCYMFDRKLALNWYMKSLLSKFKFRTLVKYVSTLVGIRDRF